MTARSRLTKALTVAGLIAAAVALAIAVVNYDFEHSTVVRATMSGGPTYSGTFSSWLEIPRLRLAAIGAAVVVLAILVLRNMLPRLRPALVAALALLTVYLAVWLAALVYIQLG